MFKQTDAIRDFIFPLASIKTSPDGIEVKRVLGSAFLIGQRGFALTAKHVISGQEGEKLAGIFVSPDGYWLGLEIISRDEHPTEDVALVRLTNSTWRSFFRLANTSENSSCKYRLFGYPDDTTFELTEGSKAIIRPDLVYNEGYIRRQYTGSLPAIHGNSFYELSQVAGSGASGSPVFKFTAPIWDVIGIYVGEKTNDRATSVSYAVREDSFRNWAPPSLGKTVLEESQEIPA